MNHHGSAGTNGGAGSGIVRKNLSLHSFDNAKKIYDNILRIALL
jgi:hypothetical protein